MNLFILKTIDIRRKTEKQLQKEHKIHNIKYKKKISYEDYTDYVKSWDEYNFSYYEEDNCYFTDYKIAEQYAKENICDMNDGGVYNYIAIIEVPINCTYTITEIQNIHIFKYKRDKDKFEEIDLNCNDESKYICKKLHMLLN